MLGTTEGTLLNKYLKDYVIFDLETTGTNCNADEVIEISAIKVINEEVKEEFSFLVNPGMPIPFWATNVNGITDAMVADAPVFKDVLEKFLEFAGNLPLVGHNIHTFDMKFMYRDCQKYFGKTLSNDYVDTLKLARLYLPKLQAYKLVDLAKYYNLSTEGAHRALNDCRMNQQIFYYLGQEMLPENMKKNGLISCPNCGSLMKLRKGQYGEFMGCSGYPNCKYTMKVPEGFEPVRKKKPTIFVE